MRKAIINRQTNKDIFLILLVIFLLPVTVTGQSVLQDYIKEGLENNSTVRRQSLAWQKSVVAQKESRGYYLPTISINARYTMARGGRTFDFPAGDLLNPLFNNINTLNTAMSAINPLYPSIPAYPEADNISFRFLRPHEHETKVSLSQPIFNPAIIHNHKIKAEERSIEMATLNMTRNEIVKQISTAYYSYMQATELSTLADELVSLATENLRVCNALHNNDMITRDVLFTAQADLAKARMQRVKAKGDVSSAAALFNYLLNRPPEQPIRRDTTHILTLPDESLEDIINASPPSRPETHIINGWMKANKHYIKLQKSDRMPVVAGAVDYGFQGETYQFNSDHDFVMASVIMRWTLFAGQTVNRKIRQAYIDRQMLETEQEELTRKIEMEVVTAWNSMITTYEMVQAAAAAVQPSQSACRITEARFREGKASYAELLQAQTMLMKARQELIIKEFEYLRKEAELKHATGKIIKE